MGEPFRVPDESASKHFLSPRKIKDLNGFYFCCATRGRDVIGQATQSHFDAFKFIKSTQQELLQKVTRVTVFHK